MIDIMSKDFFRSLLELPGVKRAYPEGSTLFHTGDPVHSLHFILSGQVHLIRTRENGAPLILQRASSGGILAEASLHSSAYHCDAVAFEDAETWSVAAGTIREKLANDLDFSTDWVRQLAHEVQRVRMQAEILSVKTVKGRLDAWIAWHGDLPEKGRWAAIAREIGVSPEALYRELAVRFPQKPSAENS